MLLDNLRQHTLKSTLHRGKHLLDHTQMSKIQSNRSDKKFTCNAKKVMSLCPENLNENLVSMMTCIHNIILCSWSSAKLDSRFLSYSSSKQRVGEKSGKDVGSLGFFGKTFPTWRSVVYSWKTDKRYTETLRQKPVSSANPTASVLKTVNSTHFPRKTWIPRDIPSTQRRSYLLRFQSKLWYIYSCTVRINSCFTTSKKMCHNYRINNHFVQKRTKAFYKNFMYFE